MFIDRSVTCQHPWRLRTFVTTPDCKVHSSPEGFINLLTEKTANEIHPDCVVGRTRTLCQAQWLLIGVNRFLKWEQQYIRVWNSCTSTFCKPNVIEAVQWSLTFYSELSSSVEIKYHGPLHSHNLWHSKECAILLQCVLSDQHKQLRVDAALQCLQFFENEEGTFEGGRTKGSK